MTVELIPVTGVPEVSPGDDLAAVLEPSLRAIGIRDDDALAVTQKVVSKAEGRLVPLGERADWLARESADVVARRGDLVIVRTRHGFVCANAGIDSSNVPEGLVSLLPEDPDASAERLRKDLSARLRVSRLGVIVTDTFGRPWREGVVDVAIGCAGLSVLLDLRGSADDRGRPLETTVVAIADALAAASGLVMTKAARVPAAVIRGLDRTISRESFETGRSLVRAPEDDLFRISPLQAIAGTRIVEAFGAGPVDAAAVEDAVEAVSESLGRDLLLVALTAERAVARVRGALDPIEPVRTASAFVVVCAVPASGPGSALRGHAAIGALAVALHARGLRSWWDETASIDATGLGSALALGSVTPLGIVAIGNESRGGA